MKLTGKTTAADHGHALSPAEKLAWDRLKEFAAPSPVLELDEVALDRLLSLRELDVTATLKAAAQAMADRHAAEVRALELDQQFAVLHSSDPRAGRSAPPSLAEANANGWTLPQWESACDKLVQVGGDGTPMVQELPIFELGIARGVHAVTARNDLAAGLDLDHRLPGIWAAVQEGRGQVWVAKKVAAMSRHLDRHQVRVVDVAVSKAWDQAPGRVLSIADAAIMRADPDHARQAAEERARRRYVVLGRSDERGLRKVFGLIDAGDASWLDAMLELVADKLETRPDLASPDMSRDELRAQALGWLCHPEDVLALINGTYTSPVVVAGEDHDPPADDPDPQETEPAPIRSRAVLHVHLSQAAVEAFLCEGTNDVVRVEELGPMLISQLARLVGHARITLKPVIDLNQNRSVNGYEHPPDVHERSFLRACGDVFPHAQTQSRRVDGDHPDPYQRDGPPGQTGDHNHAPLTRRSHRAKTHLPYQLIQIGLGRYLWRSPHGLYRLVDGTGTHKIDEATAWRILSHRAGQA